MKHFRLSIRTIVDDVYSDMDMELIAYNVDDAIRQVRSLYEIMDKTKLDNICLETEYRIYCLFYREVDCPHKNVG